MPTPAGPTSTLSRSLGPLAVALFAGVLIFGWQALAVHYVYDNNWTALFCTGDRFPIPPQFQEGTYVFSGTEGYDAAFYRYIAHDPVFREGLGDLTYLPDVRYRRILVSGLAHILALGRGEWIDFTYIGVVLVFLVLGVYWTAAYFELHGRRPLWGLIFLLVPATLTSIGRLLLDGPLTALFAGFLYYAARRSWTKALAVAAAAALTRETGLLLVAGLVGSALLEKQYRRSVGFAAAALPTLGWYVFTAWHVRSPEIPMPLEWPLLGQLKRLFVFREFEVEAWRELVFQTVDFLAVVGLLGSIAFAALCIAKRRPGPVEVTVGLFAVLGLVLGDAVYMTEAYGFARPVSPLLLFVIVTAVKERLWWGLPPSLMMTASIGLFFVAPTWRIVTGLLAG